MSVTREQVAALADGQLEGEEARAVAAAVAADPALEAEFDAHRALRARLAAHFAPIAAEPVPERLRAALGEGVVIDLAAFRAGRAGRRGNWLRYAAPALAASLLMAVLGINAWQARHYAGAEVAGALDRQLAMSAAADAPVRVLLSFRDQAGQFCRAFDGRAGSGIACRDARGWRLHRLPGAVAGQQAEYRQAGSEDAAVMARAQAMAAGPALDAAQEAAAVRRGWR
jgi:hypothetical protein